jgi:hypothetical protein
MEQASFDPGEENIRATAAGNQQEGQALCQDQPNPEPAELTKIKDLPKEVGVMLITAGIVGFILPGPGTPAIMAGGLVLWPKAFGKLESWLERSHPKVHRKGLQQINRFLNDLQKRYPDTTN